MLIHFMWSNIQVRYRFTLVYTTGALPAAHWCFPNETIPI